MPFNLTYGTEAVIPIEIGHTSLEKEFFNERNNEDQLKLNLDCLNEVRTKPLREWSSTSRRWPSTTTKG